MTTADRLHVTRKAWFLALARRYVRRRLSKSFEGVWIAGLHEVEAALQRPTIIAANHVSWWDAFLIVLVDQLLGTESYCLMETANLRRYPFFGWIGAVPLERGSLRQGLRDLRASARLLDRPGRLLWIFPQGRQRPAHLRPLRLERGVEKLAAWSGAPVLPLSISYCFRESPWPAAFGVFGPMLEEPSVETLEQRLVDGLDRIDRLCDEGGDPAFAGFDGVLRGRGTGPETRIGARLLTAGRARGPESGGNGA